MDKSIYDLGLHEFLTLSPYENVRRVPGGWIYRFTADVNAESLAFVFVPFNNEFETVANMEIEPEPYSAPKVSIGKNTVGTNPANIAPCPF